MNKVIYALLVLATIVFFNTSAVVAGYDSGKEYKNDYHSEHKCERNSVQYIGLLRYISYFFKGLDKFSDI